MIPGLGWSAGDVIKLIELSADIYLAFQDASRNSSSQVGVLVKEFERFHEFLQALAKLLKKYGRPLPFGYDDFRKTLKDCETFLKPYADVLVNNPRKSLSYGWHTIKFVGKDKDVDRLRKQIDGHVQSLQLSIDYIQLEIKLEERDQRMQTLPSRLSTIPPIQEERTLDLNESPDSRRPRRTRSTRVLSFSTPGHEPRNPFVVLDPEAEELSNGFLRFEDWLSRKEKDLSRTSGESPALDAVSHLRKEVSNAFERAENRAKRATAEEIIERANALNSHAAHPEHRRESAAFSHEEAMPSSEGLGLGISRRRSSARSTANDPIFEAHAPSSSSSPFLSDRLGTQRLTSLAHPRPSSVASRASYESSPRSPEDYFQWSNGNSFSHTPSTSPLLHQQSEAGSHLTGLELPPAALAWTCITENAKIAYVSEKGSSSPFPCTISSTFRRDGGLTVRAELANGRGAIEQEFLPHRTPIPLPIHDLHDEGLVFITFPQGLRGCIKPPAIKSLQYTMHGEADSTAFQSLLYEQELLFSRNILVINSDKYEGECRNQSLRLWVKHNRLSLLFYTNTRPPGKDKHCWIQEPQAAFERLASSEATKSSSSLTLRFRKSDDGKTKEKAKSKTRTGANTPDNESMRRGSTFASTLSTPPTITPESEFRNAQSLKKLEIKFKTRDDRKSFVTIWQEYIASLFTPS